MIDPTNNTEGDIFEEIVRDTLNAIEDNLSYIVDENLTEPSAVTGDWHEWFWDNRNEIKEVIMDKIKIDL